MITSLCTLLKGRSIRVLRVQLLLTFMLIARATNKQVRALKINIHCNNYTLKTLQFRAHVQAITVLNLAGLCVSYTSVWKYLSQLTTQAQFLDIIREGHWLWVFDNLNVHQCIRHERQGEE